LPAGWRRRRTKLGAVESARRHRLAAATVNLASTPGSSMSTKNGSNTAAASRVLRCAETSVSARGPALVARRAWTRLGASGRRRMVSSIASPAGAVARASLTASSADTLLSSPYPTRWSDPTSLSISSICAGSARLSVRPVTRATPSARHIVSRLPTRRRGSGSHRARRASWSRSRTSMLPRRTRRIPAAAAACSTLLTVGLVVPTTWATSSWVSGMTTGGVPPP